MTESEKHTQDWIQMYDVPPTATITRGHFDEAFTRGNIAIKQEPQEPFHNEQRLEGQTVSMPFTPTLPNLNLTFQDNSNTNRNQDATATRSKDPRAQMPEALIRCETPSDFSEINEWFNLQEQVEKEMMVIDEEMMVTEPAETSTMNVDEFSLDETMVIDEEMIVDEHMPMDEPTSSTTNNSQNVSDEPTRWAAFKARRRGKARFKCGGRQQSVMRSFFQPILRSDARRATHTHSNPKPIKVSQIDYYICPGCHLKVGRTNQQLVNHARKCGSLGSSAKRCANENWARIEHARQARRDQKNKRMRRAIAHPLSVNARFLRPREQRTKKLLSSIIIFFYIFIAWIAITAIASYFYCVDPVDPVIALHFRSSIWWDFDCDSCLFFVFLLWILSFGGILLFSFCFLSNFSVFPCDFIVFLVSMD
eukprot:1167937_1